MTAELLTRAGDLPVSHRFYDVGLEDYISGADLLDSFDHERELYLLLLALRRGQSGEYYGRATPRPITRVW